MDISIGPECFIDSERTVISYQGENYYLACKDMVMVFPDGEMSFCVKRMSHPGNVHEDFEGNICIRNGLGNLKNSSDILKSL